MDNLIEKYLGEGLTKSRIFNSIMDALSDKWMDVDQISKATQLPMSKHGISAHMAELVKKGKAKESMNKGKLVWLKK